MQLSIICPDYSCLSKRLAKLEIVSPRYKKADTPSETLAAIAMDSAGLKRFGRDEWHQEKHNIAAKRSWRKLHIAVDTQHVIHASFVTDRFTSDDQAVEDLTKQITINVTQITADGAYEKNPVYEIIAEKFPAIEMIIPPDSDDVYSMNSHPQINQNLQEVKTFRRMNWQRVRGYGKRNYSELCIQRYKKIIGNKLHARELSRQKNETTIGCGVLNRMTSLGMPSSYRSA